MDQPTFAGLEYQGKKRKTRRELFLERMDALIPWQKLEERIRPVYATRGNGRRPCPIRCRRCCGFIASNYSTVPSATSGQAQRPGHGGPALSLS